MKPRKTILFTLSIFTLLVSLSIFSPIMPIKSQQLHQPTKNQLIPHTTPKSSISSLLQQVQTQRVQHYLTDIVNFGRRPTQSNACKQTAAYLYDTLQEFNLTVEYQNYTYPLVFGTNVIATQPGSHSNTNEFYILSAHYDTWWNTTGANDDASGIAAMLTIAEILSKHEFNHTIKYIAFSGHETGPGYLYGSTYYAKHAYETKQNILGVLNMDMIGNTTNEGNAIQIQGKQTSQWLLQHIQQINQDYAHQFTMTIEQFYNYPGADETSFMDYGYDAILFIQSHYWKPPNHQPEDNITTINFDFLTNATQLILASIATLANKPIPLDVCITQPKEDSIYIFDNLVYHSPGIFNLRNTGLRAMTYLLGDTTITLNITTDQQIKTVYFIIDDQLTYKNTITHPPYQFKLKQKNGYTILTGKHTITVCVVTKTGSTAYDEMDVYFLP